MIKPGQCQPRWLGTALENGLLWFAPVLVDFVDAVKIVRARGAYMQEAVPVGVGAMAAILGLEDQIIIDACESARRG
jgi:[acyl-carrier-protein] S-malonyltransferase